jgi:hypothetical protein
MLCGNVGVGTIGAEDGRVCPGYLWSWTIGKGGGEQVIPSCKGNCVDFLVVG